MIRSISIDHQLFLDNSVSSCGTVHRTPSLHTFTSAYRDSTRVVRSAYAHALMHWSSSIGASRQTYGSKPSMDLRLEKYIPAGYVLLTCSEKNKKNKSLASSDHTARRSTAKSEDRTTTPPRMNSSTQLGNTTMTCMTPTASSPTSRRRDRTRTFPSHHADQGQIPDRLSVYTERSIDTLPEEETVRLESGCVIDDETRPGLSGEIDRDKLHLQERGRGGGPGESTRTSNEVAALRESLPFPSARISATATTSIPISSSLSSPQSFFDPIPKETTYPGPALRQPPESPRRPSRLYPRFRVNSAHSLGALRVGSDSAAGSANGAGVTGTGIQFEPGSSSGSCGSSISILRSADERGVPTDRPRPRHRRTGSGPPLSALNRPGSLVGAGLGLKITTSDLPGSPQPSESSPGYTNSFTQPSSPLASPVKRRSRGSRGEGTELDPEEGLRRGLRTIKATRTVKEVLESEERFRDGLRVVIEVSSKTLLARVC